MTLIVFEKLSIKAALETARDIEQWFLMHPTKKVCVTDLFKVRRNHLVEDILKHSVGLGS